MTKRASAAPLFPWTMIAAALACGVGLEAPWLRATSATPGMLTWIAIPALAGRWFGAPLNIATEAVTIFAVGAALLGAVLRVWSAARTSRLLCYTAPAEIGALLVALAVAILMPLSGAAFFLAVLAVIGLLRRVASVRKRTRRISRHTAASATPTGSGNLSGSNRRPWWRMVAAESFSLGYAFCLALFAWRYSAQLMIRCLLICFGGSLVLRALLPRVDAAETAPEKALGAA